VVSAFAVSSLFLLLIAVYQRRRRIAERMALQAEANARLEVRVRERTSELLMSNRRLRASIEERDRAELELRQAQQELIQASKLAALGQMSAGLSHELNQPLSAIRSYADNAVAFLERENTDRARSNLSGIAELTERMARIIRNLRTYARNEQTPIRPVSVKDAITSASLLLESKARSAEAEIRLNLPEEDLVVMGGDVRLQQVFVNLLSNAIDAVADSAVRLIDVSVFRQGDEVHCRVRDSGPGIPQNEIGSVFDPFFSTKAVGQGMGLGLSITIGIVEQFGGRIVAGNRPQGGAEFLVVLRLAEEGRSAAE
jgi:two-component system C4-dicarboxylate transport sensor histidine kinase DctB